MSEVISLQEPISTTFIPCCIILHVAGQKQQECSQYEACKKTNCGQCYYFLNKRNLVKMADLNNIAYIESVRNFTSTNQTLKEESMKIST